jgi:hypothetical protein
MFEGCPLGALGSWVGSGVSGLTGRFGRGGQLRCQTAAPILQVFKRPTGIQAGASANELRDLLKRGETSCGAISSTERSWSSSTAAMTSSDAPSAAAQRISCGSSVKPKRFVILPEYSNWQVHEIRFKLHKRGSRGPTPVSLRL